MLIACARNSVVWEWVLCRKRKVVLPLRSALRAQPSLVRKLVWMRGSEADEAASEEVDSNDEESDVSGTVTCLSLPRMWIRTMRSRRRS